MLNIVFLYSKEDSLYQKKIVKHFTELKRKKTINLWSYEVIQAGQQWENEIHKKLGKADIIIPLISVDFIDSEYCYEIELKKAIEQQKKGKSEVLPVILHPCSWQETMIKDLQVIPNNGFPVVKGSVAEIDSNIHQVYQKIKETILDTKEQKEEEIKSYKEIIAQLKKEKDGLDNDIVNFSDERKKLNDELQSLKDKISDSENVIQEFENEYEEKLEEEKQQFQAKEQQVQVALRKKEQDCSDLALNLEKEKNKNSELNKKLSKLLEEKEKHLKKQQDIDTKKNEWKQMLRKAKIEKY